MQSLNKNHPSNTKYGRRKHILLAEDEPNAQFAISISLKKAGFLVTVVENGEEALEKIKELQDRGEAFDLLLTDIEMPHLNGLELIDKIKGLAISLPAIIITGYGNKTTMQELIRKGCSEFLDKPFRPEELTRRVEMAFEKQTRLRAAKEKHLKEIERDRDVLSGELEAYRQKMQALRNRIDSTVPTSCNLIETDKGKAKIMMKCRYRFLHYVCGMFLGIKNTKNGCNVLLAEVAGHDPETSFHTLAVKTVFDDRCQNEIDGRVFFRLLNNLLLKYGRSKRPTTALFIHLNLETMQGQVVSAAHPPLVKITAAYPAAVATSVMGDILGIEKQVNFDTRTFPLKSGDRFILHSENVWDSSYPGTAPDFQKKSGKNRLHHIITEYFPLPLEKMVGRMWQDIVGFLQPEFQDKLLLAALEVP